MATGTNELDPKAIPVRNAWYLLLYAWDLAQWKGRWGASAEVAPNLLGLLARVLTDATADLLRRRLTRAHQLSIREIRGIRGRIDFSRSLKRFSFNSGRAVCAFPEMSVNTLRNQVIRSTLVRLSKDERITIGAAPEEVQALRTDIHRVLSGMEQVSSIRVQSEHFGKIQLGRNDSAYQVPLAVCQLLHQFEMPTETRGDHAVAALVRDEIKFSTVFERFVRNFLRHSLRNATVRSETLLWPDECQSSLVPHMSTDISIEWTQPVGRRVVIDTKFYRNTLASRGERLDKFHSGHLYQLYAYLRTQEDRGEMYRSAKGMLVYPTTSASINERMRVQGHEMRVATVDLGRPWPEIEQRLLDMVSPD